MAVAKGKRAKAVEAAPAVEPRKYELVESDTITDWRGVKLFRIRALVAIGPHIAAGDLGGYVEGEKNLSQVSGNAQVYGNARVYGNAWVYGNAQVSGNARVYGNARVQTINVTATRTDGYTFLVAPTPQGARITAGCRYFSFDEAEAHWTRTRGGTKLGDESLSIVAHLKRMAELNGFMEPVVDPAPVAEQAA